MRQQTLPVQLIDLTRMQLSNWRWSWRGMVITGMVTPLVGIFALSAFARDSGPQTLSYILIGNLVMSLMFENLGKVSSNFSFMRAVGTMGYFASLPIHRNGLIIATVTSFLVLSLPALVVTALAGSLFLQIRLHVSPLILVVIPLAALPLAGIGALIGARSRTMEEAGSLSTLVTFALLALGPVVIPPEHLPDILLALGHLSPATYASSALRQALLGPVTPRIVLDLAILAIFGIGVLWLAGQKMDWRQ